MSVRIYYVNIHIVPFTSIDHYAAELFAESDDLSRGWHIL